MHREFLMGNEAIALGTIAAGVTMVTGYPGTPSTEVLETIAKRKTENIYVEWSTNEKAALEVASGASFCGARTLVTMKQVGLNVASDPLMSLAYIGVKGGMVVMAADDPGPISSQTEQDTRSFAAFAKLPVFDPSSVQEAYEMIAEAFEYSEKYETPVLFRPTTRICHAYASVVVKDYEQYECKEPEGFVRDKRLVIFPKLSYENHLKIEERNEDLKDIFSNYERNKILYGENRNCKRGIAAQGISFSYVMEALKNTEKLPVLKIATPFPFPEKLAVEFLQDMDEVLCVEELDPVIERELTYICGKYHLQTRILGKLTGHIQRAGENTRDSVKETVFRFADKIIEANNTDSMTEEKLRSFQNDRVNIPEFKAPALPVRPPVLCAGCPHRASFYAVKKAMEGENAVFCGDIGCYTLGNAMPLDMVDTCLCMGAGITIAQGIGRMEPDKKCFAFVGDSTFFASAITGIINAKYNQSDLTVVILDNSTTAMTGHQPHPGSGMTMMGEIGNVIDIEKVLQGIGVDVIETINPFNLEMAVDIVKQVSALKGVKAIIFKAPCIAVMKSQSIVKINSDKCVNCKKCVKQLGCPGILIKDGKVTIDASFCRGCGLCKKVCPVNAIEGGGNNE